MIRWLCCTTLILLTVLPLTGVAAENHDDWMEEWNAKTGRRTATQPGSNTSNTQDYWKLNWRNFAKRCALVDGQYYCLPAYDEDHPSSKGVTVDRVIAEHTQFVNVTIAPALSRQERVTISRAEAEALACPLPAIAVGQYGQIHSAQVQQILGPEEMAVDQVWLIDADALRREQDAQKRQLASAAIANRNSIDSIANQVRRWYVNRDALVTRQRRNDFRQTLLVKGLPTHRLTVGARWLAAAKDEPLRLAIVDVQDEPIKSGSSLSLGAGRSQRRFVAVPVSRFRKGLDEEEFRRMLATRGLDPEQFVRLVIQEKKDNPKDAQVRVLNRLQDKPDAPPAAESEPKPSKALGKDE